MLGCFLYLFELLQSSNCLVDNEVSIILIAVMLAESNLFFISLNELAVHKAQN